MIKEDQILKLEEIKAQLLKEVGCGKRIAKEIAEINQMIEELRDKK